MTSAEDAVEPATQPVGGDHGLGRVVGVGWIVVDTCYVIDAYPSENTKCESLMRLVQVGGPAVRALMLLSRMGHATRLIGEASSDRLGDDGLAELVADGVEVDWVRRTQERGREASVWLAQETGSRTIVYADAESESLETPSRAALHDASWLHLDGRHVEVAQSLAIEAQTSGIDVSIDLGGYKPDHIQLIDHCSAVLGPLSTWQQIGREIGLATDALIERAASRGYAIVTEGSEAATLYVGSTAYRAHPTQVQAVDSNGAGDVFAGAFIHAIMSGREPENIIRYAAACAALKCTVLGNSGIPGMHHESELNRWAAQEVRINRL